MTGGASSAPGLTTAYPLVSVYWTSHWRTEDLGVVEAARAIEPLCVLWCLPGFVHGPGFPLLPVVAADSCAEPVYGLALSCMAAGQLLGGAAAAR